MKANQVYSFFKGFKFSKNFLLMNYKLNKILSQTSKRNADLSHTNSWGHKLYIKSSDQWETGGGREVANDGRDGFRQWW